MALFFQSKYTESAAAACGSLERKRTVDAHLEHIFGKLGITSRVQLATTQLSPAATSPERPPPRPGPPGP